MFSHLLAPALARRGIHYGWAVVAVTFLTMLGTAAAMGMPGVLLLPLKGEFRWDLGEISGALALRLLRTGWSHHSPRLLCCGMAAVPSSPRRSE